MFFGVSVLSAGKVIEMGVEHTGSGGLEVRLCSGEPWNLVLKTERVGSDLVCRVHGGAAHVGGVAVGRWDGQRVEMAGEIRVGEHKEGPLASVVAHQLCKAARTTVICVCGIHYDGISAGEIRAIEGEVHGLCAQAATLFDDAWVAQALDKPGGVFAEIHSRAAELYPRVKAFLECGVEELCARAGDRERENPRVVSLFAPLYLSNACPNDCVYCGFRRSADFERRHLNLEEAVREAKVLAGMGFGTIDLVTGEIPTDRFVDSVCEVMAAIRERTTIQRMNLNMGALTAAQFGRLRDAGAAAYYLYQETYDPDVYREVHRHGRKRDMAHRLSASVEMVEAGFDSIGLGVLLGLREPAFDLACLCAHASILREIRPGVGVGFSLPRIQEVDESCSYAPACEVDDALFIKCVLLIRALNPDGHITLTSRESPAIREVLLPMGITKMSASVSTSPGGYSDKSAKAQFSISDARSLEEVAGMIRALGLEAVV